MLSVRIHDIRKGLRRQPSRPAHPDTPIRFLGDTGDRFGGNGSEALTPVAFRKLTPEQRSAYLAKNNSRYGIRLSDIDDLVVLASAFATAYPSNRYAIFGFGRTPLPFLEIAKLMQNGIEDYTAIPGSGMAFLALDAQKTGLSLATLMSPDQEVYMYVKNRMNLTLQQSRKANALRASLLIYKNVLKSLKMSPQDIIDRWAWGRGKKTLVVDGVDSGRSIRNLALFLSLWAHESMQAHNLRLALAYHLYFAEDREPPGLGSGFEYHLETPRQNAKVVQFAKQLMEQSHRLGIEFPVSEAADYSGNLNQDMQASYCSDMANVFRFLSMQQLSDKRMLK